MVKFPDDEKTYLGNQLECEFGGERVFGVLADMEFILVATYKKDGTAPELALYKKRQSTAPSAAQNGRGILNAFCFLREYS